MASNQDAVEIEFRAKVDDLIAGLQQATAAMGNGFQAITEVVNKASLAIEQELAGAIENATNELGKLNQGNEETSAALDDIAGKVNVAFAFGVVQKAKEYVLALVDAVRALGAVASDVLDTAYAFGITTRELQGLRALSASTGTDFEALNRTLLSLQGKLLQAAQGSQEAADELATFGINARDFNDSAFTSVDALVKIAQSSTTAAERIQLFGNKNVSVLGILGPLSEGITSVGTAADGAGAATREQLQTLSDFANLANVISNTFENLKTRLLSGTVPAITAFYKVVQDVVGRAGPIRDVLAVAFKILGVVIATVISATAGALQVVRGVIDAFLRLVKTVLQALSDMLAVVEQILVGNFSEAWEKAKQGANRFGTNFTELKDGIVSDAKAAGTAVADLFKTMMNPKVEGTTATDPEKRPDRGKVTAKRGAKDDVAERIKFEYDLEQQGSEKRIQLANELVTRMALIYGQDSEQFRGAIRMQLEAVRQYNEAQAKLAEERLERARVLAQGEVDIREQQFQAEIDAGRVSGEQIYKQQEEFAAQRLAIEEEYFNKLRQLRADDALATAQAEQEQLLARQEREKVAVENMNQRTKAIRAQWEEMLSPISSAFSGAIQGMIQGTETLSNAVRKMALNIVLSFADMAIKKTIKWIAGEIAMTQATAANTVARSTMEETSSKKGIISGAFTALKKIAQFAATAAAGAFQAIVSIPYVGPFLAPAAAVAAGAAVLAIGRSIASAAGGWEVPSDQLAMVHKDEMVLPARLSQGLKSLIFDRSSGEGASGGSNVFAPTVMAMDGQSVDRFFKKNGAALARAMWDQAQRFNPKTAQGTGNMMWSAP